MPDTINPFKTATETRNLEINLFWQRSNYFLVLNTAIATGAILKIDKPEYAFPLSIFGLVVALMWVCINLGGKYWQSRWERKAAKIELQEGPSLELFSVSREVRDQEVRESLSYEERKWYQFWRGLVNFLVLLKPSVSRTMILLSIAFAIFWIAIALSSMGLQLRPPSIVSQPGVGHDSLTASIQLAPTEPSTGFFYWGDSFWAFVAVVLGILVSFWIERRISAKQSRAIQKSLTLLVAEEVENNIGLMTQIVSQAQQNIVPYYQLVHETKNACWPLLVKYPLSKRELIKGISASYFEYQLINRTLDMIFFKEGLTSSVFSQSTIPLCKTEIERSKKLLVTLKDWANS